VSRLERPTVVEKVLHFNTHVQKLSRIEIPTVVEQLI